MLFIAWLTKDRLAKWIVSKGVLANWNRLQQRVRKTSRRRKSGRWEGAVAVSRQVEVVERREVLTVTPVVSLSQAQTDYQAAQVALDQALASYNSSLQQIMDQYNSNMAGHYGDYNSAISGLSTQFQTTEAGILANWQQQNATVESGFQSQVAGLVSTLETDLQADASTYDAAMSTAQTTLNSARAGIEATFQSDLTAAGNQLSSDEQTAWNTWNSTLTSETGTLDSSVLTAQTTYNSAVSGLSSSYDTTVTSTWFGYDTTLGDSTSGLIGTYYSQQSTAATTRDQTLAQYPGVTYDPGLIDPSAAESLWSAALSTVQSGLDQAGQTYDATAAQLQSDYNAALSDAYATYNSLMQAADATRNSAYQAADAVYNSNVQTAQNAWNDAVNGPGGIEETYNNALAAAESARQGAWNTAQQTYDDSVQLAADAFQAAVDAANKAFDDWLNGNTTDASGNTVPTVITVDFTITRTVDSSTSPPTVSWTSTLTVTDPDNPTQPTETTDTKEPLVPAGYVLLSEIITVSGTVETTTRQYGTGSGNTPASGSGGTSGTPFTPPAGVRNNPWEIAGYLRTVQYATELEGFQQEYNDAAQTAYDSHQSAVDAASAAYMTTLYGNPTGAAPFGAGTPAQVYAAALTAAMDGFTSDEAAAFQTYTTSMDGYWTAFNAWMMASMDPLNMGTATPPPDPSPYAKDYAVDVAAANVNYASSAGAAWVAWVTAESGAATARDQTIIQADWQMGMDLEAAAKTLADNSINAEDSWASALIDIDADYEIAISDKAIDREKSIVTAAAAFDVSEHAAAATLGHAGIQADHDATQAGNAARAQRMQDIAGQNNTLSKAIATEAETQANSYASADAVWINAEAGAGQSATTLAAAAGYAFDTGLIAAAAGYVNSAAPLLTSATQSFNAAFAQAYAAAVNNDPDQVAVAGAWQQYSDALASDYQTLLTSAASAFQSAGDTVASAAQTLANQIASEGVTEADSIASAWTTFVGNVAPAAKTLAFTEADAEKTFVQTVANKAQTADDQDADATKTFADTAVDEGQTYEDNVTDAAQTFLQAVADADKPHQAALINNARDARQQDNTAVTQLAQGVVDEQDNLNKDALNEGKAAATQASSLDDALMQAMADRDATAAVLQAAQEHDRISQMPTIEFEPVGGHSGPTAGVAAIPYGSTLVPHPHMTQVVYLAVSGTTLSELNRINPGLIDGIRSNLSRIGLPLGIDFNIELVTIPNILTTGFFGTEHNMTAPVTASDGNAAIKCVVGQLVCHQFDACVW